MEQSNLLNSTLILGFFDGIHIGHRKVIESAVNFAHQTGSKTVLLTFPESPAEYFNGKNEYIYNRIFNYEIIKSLGVDVINEENFSDLVNITAEDYLKAIIEKYSPIGIFTGFNYTFGANRQGTPELFKKYEDKYNYKYFCIESVKKDNTIVSSTLIKELLKNGDIESANNLLNNNFVLESEVIKGVQRGRELGFPTANMIYPDKIIGLPFGVYKVDVLNKTGVMNWGIKPTFNNENPILEVHIPGFNGDLYGKKLKLKVLKRIRGERKFNSAEDLKSQIHKDIEECLK